MEKLFSNNLFSFLLLSIVIVSCTEPYALQTNTFEDAIVVEATLTNELKKQEINLSRTYKFEENGPTFESDAIVFVIDDFGNQYDFEEVDGKYVSTSEFQVEPNRNYQLHIATQDGKSYVSTNEKLTTVNEIQDVVPTVITKEGIRGVEMRVKSFDPTNTSKYYRYKYEETSKLTAPKWNQYEARLVDPLDEETPIELVLRPEPNRICYRTEKSNGLFLTNTNSASEDRVNFPIRFIAQANYAIAERYSIEVTQYIQNIEAHNYYNLLKKIAGEGGSLLSQNQPGFFSGNVKSANNPEEKVIGFFEVASVSHKRIFFDYTDLFPGEPYPEFYDACEVFEYQENDFLTFELDGDAADGLALREKIENGSEVFYELSGVSSDLYFRMVHRICGDCTADGSNIRPSFWID